MKHGRRAVFCSQNLFLHHTFILTAVDVVFFIVVVVVVSLGAPQIVERMRSKHILIEIQYYYIMWCLGGCASK